MVSGKGERPTKRLADLLVELGLVDRVQLARAVSTHKSSGRPLSLVLVDLGLVEEDRYVREISKALDLESVSLPTLKVHDRVLGRVPARLARRASALPIAIKRANGVDYLYVVLADPLDAETVVELQHVTGCQLSLLVAAPSQLELALERYYPGDHRSGPVAVAARPSPAARPVLTASSPEPSARVGASRTAKAGAPTPQPRQLRGQTDDDAGYVGRGRGVRVPDLGLLPPDPAESSARTHIDPALLEVAPPNGGATVDPRDFELSEVGGSWEDGRTLDVAVDEMDPEELRQLLGAATTTRRADSSVDEVDMATSEVDLSDERVAAALREADAELAGQPDSGLDVEEPEPTPAAIQPPIGNMFVSALELPVDVGDKPSPFDGMNGLNLPAGLERTGIIPVLDWDNEEFEPPAPSEPPPDDRRLLIGLSDIPASAEEVRVRAERVGASDPEPVRAKPKAKPARTERVAKRGREEPAAPERMATELAQPLVDDISDLHLAAPVATPFEADDLVEEDPPDLSDDAIEIAPREPTAEASTPWADLKPEPTPAVDRLEREDVLAELDPDPDARVPTPVGPERPGGSGGARVAGAESPAERGAARREAEPGGSGPPRDRRRSDPEAVELVQALRDGRSLRSADRAQLVLALGRLLLRQGLIDADDLAAELSE